MCGMQPVLTAAQMAELDRYTIETLGLDSKLLMSNAAREVLRVMRERLPRAMRPVIFAGTGNNGGDGVALAYYAQQEGLAPTLVLCHPEIGSPPQLSADSTYFYNIAERAYVPVRLLGNPAVAPEVITNAQGDLVVDALFGTGLDRPLGSYYLALIERLHHTRHPVVAIDCPSGLNCTSGEVMEGAVRATLTVTMGFAKRGFFHPAAADHVGELQVVQLGFGSLTDAAIAPDAHSWPDALWEPLRQPRASYTHKGTYGRVLVVAGHARYPGAPRLAARAALRSGAGLVRLVVPAAIHAACASDPSVMVAAHRTDSQGGFGAPPEEELLGYLDWADALVIGPGLGEGGGAAEITRELLARRDLPIVVDADGLRALGDGRGGPMPEREWPIVLTPHVGELARLAGIIPSQALDRWFDLAREMAARLNVLLLAKSNQCVLATPEGGLVFPRRGHPALASGGTGDVLSGILGALLARYHAQHQGQSPGLASTGAVHRGTCVEIVASAVNIHASAAEVGAQHLGHNGLTATDLVDLIPAGLHRLVEGAAG